MARWESSYGAGSAKDTANVDTIDLTLSSPEPEQRPKATPRQQSFPAYVKTEPRQTNPSRLHARTPLPRQYFGQVKTEPTRRLHGGIVKAERPQHQGRAISPQHLAMIIDTSSPHALKEVLLHLCHMSPALSGAVARGLTPYSTYASGLVRQHRQPSPASTNSTVEDDQDDESDTYMRMRQKLGLHTPSQKPKSQTTSSIMPQASTSHSKLHGRYNRRMDEYGPDLDNELNLPLPSSARQANVSGSIPAYTFTSGTTRQPPKPLFQHHVSVPVFKEMYCTQCHEPYEDENETCFYHPEAKTAADGTRICTGCEGPIDDLGCQIGTHARG